MNYSIQQILIEILGTPQKVTEHTGQFRFDCPYCAIEKGLAYGRTDGKGNLEVNIEDGVYKCWVCSETNDTHGSLGKLISKLGNKYHYNRYLAELAQQDKNIILGRTTHFKLKKKDLNLGLEEIKLYHTYKDFDYSLIDSDKQLFKAYNYLRDRNITNTYINKYKIRYCDKFEKTGDLRSFYGRIIFPSINIDGEIDYYVARDYLGRESKYKYQNPTFDKEQIIFNEYFINYDADIYLVEGVTDHIVTPNSIPMLGKNISDKLYKALVEKAKGNIIIFLDDDAFGDVIKLYDKLNIGKLKNRIRVIKITKIKGIDLDPSKINEIWGSIGIMGYLRSQRKLKISDKYSFLEQ